MGAKIAAAVAICISAGVLLAQAPPAADTSAPEEVDAQGYKYQVPKKEWLGAKGKTEEIKARGAVRQILNGQYSINDPALKLKFREYFQRYLFPLMTTEEGLKSIVKDRQDFFRDVQNAKSPDAHREIVDLTLASMTKIVTDNYRPQVRYNAMLIIINLNDQEPANLGTTQTLPEPMRTALKFILDQYKKADNPDFIKLAALLGLSRHLEWDNYKELPSTPMPAAERTEIMREMTKLAETKQAPPGRDSEAHIWMRRRAIECLSMASLKKPDPEVVATMEKLLKDESDDLNVRFMVASCLGRMALQPPAKIDAVATAKELGYLALVACDSELTRAENYRKTELEREARLAGTYSPEYGVGSGTEGGMPGGPGMMRPGSYGSPDGSGVRPLRPTPGLGGAEGGYEPGLGGYTDPSMMDPKHYRLEYVRRRMRQQLYAVQLGLTGGDDHPPPKEKTGGSTLQTSATNPTTTSATEKKDLRGVFAVAKNQSEKDEVDKVYHRVRKIIEAVEAASDSDIHTLVKDVRKELKPLEAITKRLPPPGAATPTATAGGDDVPSMPAKGKAVPAKAPAAPNAKGKAASNSPRGAPNVFGLPRSR